ncbi:hypothetical protein Tco_1210058 [Tanacetum coccineum]
MVDEDLRKDSKCNNQEKEDNGNRTNNVNAASINEVNAVGGKTRIELAFDPDMLALEDYSIFDTTSQVSPIPTTRIHKDHPLNQVIRDLQSATQTRKMSKNLKEHGFVSTIQQRINLYVDDIIFGSTKKELCNAFEKLMHEKFQMSSMGELHSFWDYKCSRRRMAYLLVKDEDGEEVDVHMYRSMIGSLKYLTYLRPDIMFAVCACNRYQVNLKVSHLHAMKRIFRYLKGQLKLGLWYPKDSPFDLVAYTDSDYAGASLDRKSTIGGGGPRRQETIRDTIAQTRFENVSKLSNDLLLARGEEVNAINADTDITLVNVQDDADNEMFDVDALNGESTTTTTTISSKGLSQDKGKGMLVELEKPLKKKDQLKLDEEIALKLQAKIDEEERITRAEEEKIDEANIAWDDIQAKVDVDYQLAKRLTELVEGSSKRAGEELEQDSIKKQKVDEDKDTIELQSLMEVIPDEEEVVIDVLLLATKSPSIVDWKIYKEGKKSYY